MDSGSGIPASVCRDQDAVDDAIEALTDEDVAKLTARGRAASVGTDLCPEDVLGEAVVLVKGGRRPWKADVPFEAHMTMVMKGIGFNRRRSMKGQKSCDLEALDARRDVGAEPALDEVVGSTLRARQLVEAVETVFTDDPVGWAVFMARQVEQMSVEETCDFAGIPREKYETVLKRVNRKLANAVESGAIK